MVIVTTVQLGTRETPNYVSYEFWDAMKMVCAINSFDVTFKPNTIRYYIPAHQVIERSMPECQEYFIDLTDADLQPLCTRRNCLSKEIWKHKRPNSVFDRIKVSTHDTFDHYFLILPNTGFYHTEVFTEMSTSHILYSGINFYVHFRRVFVDPHNTQHSIWFYGTPKYQIEIECRQDLRQNRQLLRRAITSILPRAFKLDTMFGDPS